MEKHLNATLEYVLSTISILCCCFGGLGFILSLPAYFIASNKVKNYEQNPENYIGDIKTIKTAKLVALVISIINILFLLYTLYDLFLNGGWEKLVDEWNKALEKIRDNQ